VKHCQKMKQMVAQYGAVTWQRRLEERRHRVGFVHFSIY
jgi:hypothetical protein